jgi:glucokinase
MTKPVYIGIDIGATKIAAGLVTDEGRILARQKVPSPAAAPQGQVIEMLLSLVKRLQSSGGVGEENLAGVGIAVPGIVDAAGRKVLVTPNMGLSGARLVAGIEKGISAPVVLGNDANLGMLGEKTFGAARNVQTAIGLFLGTGVGGGVIIGGKVYAGATGKGAEIGHMTLDPHGPECTCGIKGCLEAYAGRWAIERDIRAALKRGEKSSLEVSGKIKSGALAKALAGRDPLVTRIILSACRAVGEACVTLRHLFDPESIILGGGLIEACGYFIVPRVRRFCAQDPFFKRFGEMPVVAAQLEDDAVMLGAVAMARDMHKPAKPETGYPRLEATQRGQILIDGRIYRKDVYIKVNARIKKRDKKAVKKRHGTPHVVDSEELKKICKKKPSVLVVASGYEGSASLSRDARKYLESKKISCRILPTPQAALLYNSLEGKKAILIHVTR